VDSEVPYFDELISGLVRNNSFGLQVAVDGIYLFKRDYNGAAYTPSLSEGLKAEYYDSSEKVVGETQVLNIAWDWSRFSPFPGFINRKQDYSDDYSITFTGFINIPQEGRYTFQLDSDDYSILKINDEEIINQTNTIYDKTLVVDSYKIEVQYYNLGEDGALLLYWKPPDENDLEIIPPQYFSIESK